MLIAVHTADIANPAKPAALCLSWTNRVMEEFFQQVKRRQHAPL